MLVHLSGIALSVAAGGWLAWLRHRRLVTRRRLALAVGLMGLGMAVDLWPVIVGPGLYALGAVANLASFVFPRRGLGREKTGDDAEALLARSEIERELDRREVWVRKVHRT